MRRVLATVAAVVVLGTACSVTRAVAPERASIHLRPLVAGSKPLRVRPGQDPVVAVVQRVRPAVVNVTTNLLQNTGLGFEPGKGVGTGFVVRSDGVVVTNYHVVEGAQRITVITQGPDVQRYEARVIGGDASADLAVLKIPAQGLPTVALGHSSQLQLGQRVVAIGYALALAGGPTVTSGIVSALGRSITVPDENYRPEGRRTYPNVIQTDAAINPGNSGGPLVNLRGQVVGIDTAGAGAANAENIGFAIAMDAARSTIEDALANPEGPVAFLGVTSQDVTQGLAYQFNLPVHQGAYVDDVAPSGPAEDAGIKGGDVIVAFDGKTVDGSESLGSLIRSHRPGDTATVKVVHADGSSETYTVTLGVNPLP
ncbi:MAG: trypsin-like peptidase domain-containing protein [Actinobacteria bacterium]|nr:trypsin-like peptidase domain-containing protein [Actinomycetota bacterium]